MDSQSPQHPHNPKNQRRKRKDPESRDFTCECGKSYLSYAAVYTHVKNKHGGAKRFLDNIVKPERESLKRGRPKEKKVFLVTHQNQQLSIIEEAILLIHEALKKDEEGGNKILLEGNEEQRPDELVRHYDALKKKVGDPGTEFYFKSDAVGDNSQILTQFVRELNKHFLPQIATKFIWLANYLGSTCTNLPAQNQDIKIDFDKVSNLRNEAIVLSLWQDHSEIPKIVTQAFQKWVESNLRQKSDSTRV